MRHVAHVLKSWIPDSLADVPGVPCPFRGEVAVGGRPSNRNISANASRCLTGKTTQSSPIPKGCVRSRAMLEDQWIKVNAAVRLNRYCRAVEASQNNGTSNSALRGTRCPAIDCYPHPFILLPHYEPIPPTKCNRMAVVPPAMPFTLTSGAMRADRGGAWQDPL